MRRTRRQVWSIGYPLDDCWPESQRRDVELVAGTPPDKLCVPGGKALVQQVTQLCTFPDNNTQKKKKNYESAHGENDGPEYRKR